jgi:glycosyltransferase involved in cell wall biosynthesis
VAGEAALLVDPLNTAGLTTAIQHLLSDAPLRRQLIEKGFSNIQRFTWQKTAEQILALVEKENRESPP